jgi:hypothetical protein
LLDLLLLGLLAFIVMALGLRVSECDGNGTVAVQSWRRGLAVGATELSVAASGIDLRAHNATLDLSPPLANLTVNSAKSGCQLWVINNYYFEWFTFAPVSEALVGLNVTARIRAANGTVISDWARVAVIEPSPMLLPTTNITQLEQYSSQLTLHGQHLGFGPSDHPDSLVDPNVPKVTLVNAAGQKMPLNVDVTRINANATSIVLSLHGVVDAPGVGGNGGVDQARRHVLSRLPGVDDGGRRGTVFDHGQG